jgi:hypothetical protein
MMKWLRFPLAVAVVLCLSIPLFAQQKIDRQTPAPPLVQLLQAKGILTADEAATISQAASADEANARLAALLVSKGLISQQDYNNTVSAPAVEATNNGSTGAHMMNAVNHLITLNTEAPPVTSDIFQYGAPGDKGVIPAITPPRLLPIDPAKNPKGLIPDIKLGSGAMMNVYGFIKASEIYDSSNSGGGTFGNNDFPLPMLLADTGPDSGSQFHTKIRSTRAGANFYWPVKDSDTVFSGKVEFDFEGDYTTVNNRNASSVRNPQPSLRVAWVRMDTKLGDLPVFAEIGQDWTLTASSTFSDIFETTQAGAFFGNIYERLPQIKAGVQFHVGELKIQPEFAVMMGAYGDANLGATPPGVGCAGATPSVTCTVAASSTAEQNTARFGARIGSDSGQPNEEARIVFQYPFFHQAGVAPAQFIISGGHSQGSEIMPHGTLATVGTPTNVLSAAIPNCATPTLVADVPECTIANFFPTGFRFNIPQNLWTAEFQVPTPWFSIWGKYYRGGDLRFFFGSTLNTTYAALNGHASIGSNIALSGDTIQFFNNDGSAAFAPLVPVRSQGGFIELGIPLSRIFHADPEGRNAGWNFYTYAGLDSSFARDLTFEPTGKAQSGPNGLLRSDYIATSLRYKMNKWMSIVNEITWYDTRTADATVKLFRGTDSRTAHDWRNEFGTVVTF